MIHVWSGYPSFNNAGRANRGKAAIVLMTTHFVCTDPGLRINSPSLLTWRQDLCGLSSSPTTLLSNINDIAENPSNVYIASSTSQMPTSRAFELKTQQYDTKRYVPCGQFEHCAASASSGHMSMVSPFNPHGCNGSPLFGLLCV